MGETAEERARRLARMITINSTYGNIGGGSELWYDEFPSMDLHSM